MTQAETAFRIQKSDLRIRPIWHQKEERVKAHILVCFLAYVLCKSSGCDTYHQTRSNNHQTLHLTANQGAVGLIAKAQLTSAPIHENISIVVEILASEKTHFEATTGELRLTYFASLCPTWPWG